MLLAAVAAVAFTFFSLFSVDLVPSPQISFRHQATWQSTETLVVTQGTPNFRTHTVTSEPSVSDPRVMSMTRLYAEFANTGAVRALVLKSGPLNGGYEATAKDYHSAAGASMPLLNIEGQARSPARATQIAARVSRTFRAYVEQRQRAAHIPLSKRVHLIVLPALGKATFVQGRWRMGPLVALTVVIALLLLAAFSKFREERKSG